MSIDFQQVRQQINELGQKAPRNQQRLLSRKNQALEQLENWAHSPGLLHERIKTAKNINPFLRSALPLDEPLDRRVSLPKVPGSAVVIAADGSQINPDRQAAVDYCLINVGAIQLVMGAGISPARFIDSKLYYDEEMYTEKGRITESIVALMRDLGERELLAKIAGGISEPVITLTDGPLELWFGNETNPDSQEFDKYFERYLNALTGLFDLGAVTAGYIDKPGGDLFVRMLEIGSMPADAYQNAGRERPFLGVADIDIFAGLLDTYERSAILGFETKNADRYRGDLSLHFFYLNVGKTLDGRPYLARVEIPKWVADSVDMINALHAVLIDQCKIMGSKPFPYALHRSHEVAVVTNDEKQQVENMIAIELQNRGVRVGPQAFKQSHKISGHRTRFRNPAG